MFIMSPLTINFKLIYNKWYRELFAKKRRIELEIKYYNKLVRDKIPAVIHSKGNLCEIEVLQENDYIERLNKKLEEELQELENAKTEEIAGEIADVIEVLIAIAEVNGISAGEIEKTRQMKLKERGGFNKRIFLKSVTYQQLERVRPIKKIKSEIPVNIYKNNELVKECSSIQAAARWLKEDTGDNVKRYSAINNGIWNDKPYLINGIIYHFITDEESLIEHFDKN